MLFLIMLMVENNEFASSGFEGGPRFPACRTFSFSAALDYTPGDAKYLRREDMNGMKCVLCVLNILYIKQEISSL